MSTASPWLDRALRALGSAPNWCGLALAAVPLLMKGAGLMGDAAYAVSIGGYVCGVVAGGMLFGFPAMGAKAWEAELSFGDQDNDARKAIETALSAIRGLVQRNPEQRLTPPLQQQALALCDRIEALLTQWEGSKGALSLEEEFHARHLATKYLPEALKSYLAIPQAFAKERLLDNGRTAHDTLAASLGDMSRKVDQLADDLASQDSQAFLAHSRFLQQKFGGKPGTDGTGGQP